MNRRELLRGAGALAGFVLLDGIYQRHRKIFALGAIPTPRSRIWSTEDIAVFYGGRQVASFPPNGDGYMAAIEYACSLPCRIPRRNSDGRKIVVPPNTTVFETTSHGFRVNFRLKASATL
jgi:hypothetical protein